MSKNLQKRGSSLHDLADKLAEEILVKLPPFDLARCKAVCQRFRSLISSRHFVSANLNRSKSDPSSHRLLVHGYLMDPTEPCPFKSVICVRSNRTRVVGSVNGLICLVGRLYGSVTPDNIWILNPVTRLSLKLPPPSFKSDSTPRPLTIKLAFWWDGDDGVGVYKVARIVSYADETVFLEVWVSSSPDTWTTTVSDYSFHFDSCSSTWGQPCHVLIEGLAAYWIVYDINKMKFVLSLDFNTLLLKWIPVPEPLITDDLYSFGGKLNGDFVLLQQQLPSSSASVGNCMYYVWTVVIDGNGTQSWKKSFKICFDFPFDRCLGSMNGKLVFNTSDNIITLFDLEITRTKQVLEKDPQINTINNLLSAHGFVESLVSIEGFGYDDRLLTFILVSMPSSYPSGRDIKTTQE